MIEQRGRSGSPPDQPVGALPAPLTEAAVLLPPEV